MPVAPRRRADRRRCYRYAPLQDPASRDLAAGPCRRWIDILTLLALWWGICGLVFLAGADVPPTDRRSSSLPQPQFCIWLVFHLRFANPRLLANLYYVESTRSAP